MNTYRESAEKLLREAREYGTEKDLKNARASLQKAAHLFSLCDDLERQNYCLGAAGVLSISMNEMEEGLELLEKAAELGYPDLDKLKHLSRMPYEGKTLGNIHVFKKIYSLVSRNAHPLKLVRWENSSIDHWRWMKFPAKEKFVRFRKRVPEFREEDEMGCFHRYLDWVHSKLLHDPSEHASDTNPSTILDEAEKGRMVTCQEFAILLTAVLQSEGYPARVIAVMKKDYHYGHGRAHWVTEVWSDSLKKWILLDPQNNCYWKQGDNILNAYEIRKHVLDNTFAELEAFTGSNPGDGEMKSWLDFFEVIWIYRTQNLFNDWTPFGEVEEIGRRPHLLFQGGSRQMFTHHRSRDYLYPKMNQVCFEVHIEDNRASFRLTDSLAFFSHYEYSFNDGQWKKCDTIFNSPLIKGKNRFSFRGKGVSGRPSEHVTAVIERRK